MYQTLNLPLTAITGIGLALEKRLNRRGVTSVGDLLLHLPKDYLDDRQVCAIDTLQNGIPCRIQGRIVHKQARGYGRKRQVIIGLADSSGQIRLNFFHSGYMMSDARLSEGREISVRGVAERWQGTWHMTHPDWCVPEQFVPGFQPVYASLAGLSGKRIGTLIRQALKLLPVAASSPLDRFLKDSTAGGYSLLQALKQLHVPDIVDLSAVQMATERLKSEEIIVYLYLMSEKRKQAECAAAAWSEDELSRKLLASLPYPLTGAQQQAWQEISGDLASGKRMHRLLQGDVGAGKTWIAALCMAKAAGCGRQAALLAPTEVLAGQHAQTLHELFSPIGLDITLLTGSTRSGERRAILQRLQSGDLQLIVGTHALLSDDVVFNNLGLALVDEQHRFGVRQRWALTEKKTDQGGAVHLLAMTATPIPRSLALALYGDMDLSLMRGLPPGRKPVQTRVIASHRMKALAEGMQRILDDGGRIYWIVPRIDEDEDGISVDQRVELLKGYFPDAAVSGLHGRMKSAAKTAVLDAFTSGNCRILVSTTVVEVGMNVLQARLMVIEQAELYGLAQLHQLRGRVGRAGDQGYCILIAGDDASPPSLQRLKQMVDSHDGLELAEADLALRGGGDAIGTRQSGEAGFRLLDLAADAALIRHWHEKTPQFIVDEAMLKFWRPAVDSVD
jgi:ATP-dependent DNA helicase RecG